MRMRGKTIYFCILGGKRYIHTCLNALANGTSEEFNPWDLKQVKAAKVKVSVWQPLSDVIKYSNTLAKCARILRFNGSLDLKI